MKLLEEKILKDGVIKTGNVLKVDSFLNHQIDVNLLDEMGKEVKRLFNDDKKDDVNKVIEAVVKRLPYGPQYYPEDMITDSPEKVIVSGE